MLSSPFCSSSCEYVQHALLILFAFAKVNMDKMMKWLRSPPKGEGVDPNSFLEKTLQSRTISDELPAIDQLRILIEVYEHSDARVAA